MYKKIYNARVLTA